MKIERNLGFELVRATEAAALRSARWMGRGDKNGADQAAVDAMRYALDSVDMDGIVVIGEGEKDQAPMLYVALCRDAFAQWHTTFHRSVPPLGQAHADFCTPFRSASPILSPTKFPSPGTQVPVLQLWSEG